MQARVLRLTQYGHAEARTDNDLLVVFKVPAGHEVRLNDLLEIQDLELDSNRTIVNLTRGSSFGVHLAARDVHDLRLKSAHGSSRTPSRARLREP
jgi:hypothetical protein